MLTMFDGVDFERPIKRFEEAQEKLTVNALEGEIGSVALDSAVHSDVSDLDVGLELRRQYEGMNDEQRKGFDAALIALTGLRYESMVEEAINNLGGA